MKERLLEVLNDYNEREFDNEPMEVLPDVFGLGFTTYGECEQYELQLDYDVKAEKLIHYINNEVVKVEDYSIGTLISDLEVCCFDDFMRDLYHMAYDMEDAEIEANKGKGYIEVTSEEVSEVLDIWSTTFNAYVGIRGFLKFYYFDNKVNRYVGVDNSDGNFWVEEFNTLEECIAWLEGKEVK